MSLDLVNSMELVWYDVKNDYSYEERICDDLSEVILQYLSLEDKLRLECVSKQFRRTLFAKHYLLEIKPKMKIKSIKGLIKKLPKVSEIITSYDKEVNRMAIKSLIDFDKQLTKFHFDYYNLYDSVLTSMVIAKYGSTLKSSIIKSYDSYTEYMSQLTNIEELTIDGIIPDLTNIYLKHLKNLIITEKIKNENDLNRFKILIENNRNSLKRLRVESFERNDFIINGLLTSIFKLNNLIDLDLLSHTLTVTHLKQIAINSKHLKRVVFGFRMSKDNTFVDILSPLKELKELRRLGIVLLVVRDLSPEEIISMTDLSCFNISDGFQELTHLRLTPYIIHRQLLFNEKLIFSGIEKNLPKLQSLVISGLFDGFTKNLIDCSEYTADILSRLSNLQSIELWITNVWAKHEIVTQLLHKCKRISRIHIKVYQNRNERRIIRPRVIQETRIPRIRNGVWIRR